VAVTEEQTRARKARNKAAQRARNPEKQAQYDAKYHNTNRENILSRNLRWRAINLEKVMFTQAKKRRFEFTISLQDIVIPLTCPVYGIKLDRFAGPRADSKPSLDRVDNSRGYTPDNIRVISWAANRDKGRLTIDNMLKLAEYVIEHQLRSK
jgi:hypothetical protein